MSLSGFTGVLSTPLCIFFHLFLLFFAEMTDREIDYGVAANAVGEAIEQRLKGVHTGMPGVVVSYDAARKRGGRSTGD